MSTRTVVASSVAYLASVALIGCANDQTDPDGAVPTDPYDGLRFERVRRIDNPGLGVVPTPLGLEAWLARQGAIDRIVASDGGVAQSIPVDGVIHLLDGDGDTWLVQRDADLVVLDPAGGVVDSWPMEGEALTGRLTGTGPVVVVDEGGDCLRVELTEAGRMSEDIASCDVSGDLETVADFGEVPSNISNGLRVATDPETGRTYTLEPSQRVVDVYEGGALVDSFELSRIAIEIGARNGMLVALSDEQVLADIDPETGRAIAEVRVFSPDDLEHMRLTGDGGGVVLDGPGGVVFYRVNPDGHPWVLPDNPNWGQPPDNSGGGGTPGGRSDDEGGDRAPSE